MLATWIAHHVFGGIAEETYLYIHDLASYTALHGFKLTEYETVTEDNWALKLHRLRNMNIYNKNFSTPVLLSHGAMGNSNHFLGNLRNESLAFLLADRGYDVWLMNRRASSHSNKKKVDGVLRQPLPKDYFTVTFSAMADYDMSATLDFIFSKRRGHKLSIVGYSVGCLVIECYLASNHTYDDRIQHVVLIQSTTTLDMFKQSSLPIALSLMSPPFVLRAIMGRQLWDSVGTPMNEFSRFLRVIFCQYFSDVCRYVIYLESLLPLPEIFGTNSRINQTRQGLLVGMFPRGFTLFETYALYQQYRQGYWSKTDYDASLFTGLKNRDFYGTDVPPRYNFSEFGVPVSMTFSANDRLLSVDEQHRSARILRPRRIFDVGTYTHLDVIFAMYARCAFYDDMISMFDSIETSGGVGRQTYRKQVARYVNELNWPHDC